MRKATTLAQERCGGTMKLMKLSQKLQKTLRTHPNQKGKHKTKYLIHKLALKMLTSYTALHLPRMKSGTKILRGSKSDKPPAYCRIHLNTRGKETDTYKAGTEMG